MRATLNYDVAKQIIDADIWPDMTEEKHKRPKAFKGIIQFYVWDQRAERQAPAGFILADGRFTGCRRNLETLTTLAQQQGIDLQVVIVAPQPQQPKKVKEPKPQPAPKAKKDEPKPEKPALSLGEMMKARKKSVTT